MTVSINLCRRHETNQAKETHILRSVHWSKVNGEDEKEKSNVGEQKETYKEDFDTKGNRIIEAVRKITRNRYAERLKRDKRKDVTDREIKKLSEKQREGKADGIEDNKTNLHKCSKAEGMKLDRLMKGTK